MRHKRTFIIACIVSAGLLIGDIMNRPVISQMGFTLPSQIHLLPSLNEEAVLVRNPASGTWAFPTPSHGTIMRWAVYVNGLRQLQGVQYNVIPPTGSLAVRAVSFTQGASPDDTVVMEYQVQ